MSTSSTTTVTVTKPLVYKGNTMYYECLDYYQKVKQQPVSTIIRDIYTGFQTALDKLYQSLPKDMESELSADAHAWIHNHLTQHDDTLSPWIVRLAVVRDKHPDVELCIPIAWATVHGKALATYLRYCKKMEDQQLQQQLPQLLSDAIENNYYGTWRLLLKQLRQPVQLSIGGIGNAKMYWQAHRKGAIDPIFHERITNVVHAWRHGKRRYIPASKLVAHAVKLPHNMRYALWRCCDPAAKMIVKLRVVAAHPRLPAGDWSCVSNSHLYDEVDEGCLQFRTKFIKVFSQYYERNKLVCMDTVLKIGAIAQFFTGRPLIMDHSITLATAHLKFQTETTTSSILNMVNTYISTYYGLLLFVSLWRMARRLCYDKGVEILSYVAGIKWEPITGQLVPQHGIITTMLAQIMPRLDQYPLIKRWVIAGAEPFAELSVLMAPATINMLLEGRAYLETLGKAYRERNLDRLNELLGYVRNYTVVTVTRTL